ncbi:hypothetical protein [Dyadobacter sp. NIV53]|uniref:hypothetical protein n=1 Tax=Dyadobacter sp. NIV53 TaxID=2861765 RepID=UPI001C88615B|nr:hypothetical protein [Dyadobacter sp. NIV53]
MNNTLRIFIEKIEQLQSKGDQYFPDGLFPAYRTNKLIGYKRPDTTIFFSAIITFTLQSIRDRLQPQLAEKVDLICNRVVKNYPDFQNKDGLKTYNFWQTKPSRHFPNGHIFHRFEHFRIPDDIDDTAFIYLTTTPSGEELIWLKDKLKLHANGSRRQITNTYPEYKTLTAYSTWFGKNMYIEFDISVLCNIMYCIFKYNLPLDEYDTASLTYIRSVIETGRYLTIPFRCAHQYPRTALIVYHVTRLVAAFDPVILLDIKQKLINDTIQLLKVSQSPMDRVILATSLMRLGIKTERIPVGNFTSDEFKGFYFFIAGLLTAYENPMLYRFSNLPLFHMHWICEAHCWTLLAEYETLWNSVEKHA